MARARRPFHPRKILSRDAPGFRHNRAVSHRILLLDDDAQFRALVRPALEAAGVAIVEAVKGRQATHLLAHEAVDALVVDGLLPDTNGLKWIETYRREGGTAPIVFVSAFYRDLESYKKLTQQLGVSRVLHKPLDPAELADALRAELGDTPERQASRQTIELLDLEELRVDDDDEVDSEIRFIPSDSEVDLDWSPGGCPSPRPCRSESGLRSPQSRSAPSGGSLRSLSVATGDSVPPDERPSVLARNEEALRQSYLDVLPHILDLFFRAVDRARRKPEQEGVVQEARRQAHELAGTAGSFGFPELGKAAFVVERELVKIQNGNPPDWDAYDAAVSQAREVPQAHLADPLNPPLPEVAPVALATESERSRATGRRGTRSGPFTPARSGAGTPREPVSPDSVHDPRPSRAPMLPGVVEPQLPAVTAPLPNPPETSGLLGPRVLVVDDDPALIDYVEGALRGGTAQVVAATDERAIRSAPEVDVALVGLPFGQPDRSAAIVKQLRELVPDLPIALVALEDTDAVRRRAAASGADLFLAHPMGGAELQRALQRLEALSTAAPLRVLALSAASAHAVALESQPGVALERCASMSELLAGVGRVRPHVVLLDSAELMQRARLVRMSDGGDDVVLLVGGSAPPIPDVSAALPKPEDAVRWVQTLGRRLRTLRGLGPDTVTGFARRATVAPLLAARLSESRRHGRPFALAVLEVDAWDALVSEHGATVVERAIGGVANLLQSRFRLEDIRGRWNDKTLVLGFAAAAAETMAPALERVQRDVAALQLASAAGELSLSLSGGLGSAPSDGEDLRSLLLAAEGRLRAAQHAGDGALVWQ